MRQLNSIGSSTWLSIPMHFIRLFDSRKGIFVFAHFWIDFISKVLFAQCNDDCF